jgi:hypothetical protein
MTTRHDRPAPSDVSKGPASDAPRPALARARPEACDGPARCVARSPYGVAAPRLARCARPRPVDDITSPHHGSRRRRVRTERARRIDHLDDVVDRSPTGATAVIAYRYLGLLRAEPGELDAAARALDQAEPHIRRSSGSMALAPHAAARITLEVWARRPKAAAALTSDCLDRVRDRESLFFTARVYDLGARACADLAARASGDEPARELQAATSRSAARAAGSVDRTPHRHRATLVRASLASRAGCAAERSRIGDVGGASLWAEAARQWETCGNLYRRQYHRFRLLTRRTSRRAQQALRLLPLPTRQLMTMQVPLPPQPTTAATTRGSTRRPRAVCCSTAMRQRGVHNNVKAGSGARSSADLGPRPEARARASRLANRRLEAGAAPLSTAPARVQSDSKTSPRAGRIPACLCLALYEPGPSEVRSPDESLWPPNLQPVVSRHAEMPAVTNERARVRQCLERAARLTRVRPF